MSKSFSIILRGTLWVVVGNGSGRILNLCAMILAARIIGTEDFGGLGIIRNTLEVFAVFSSAALGATATRYISTEITRDIARTGKIVSLISVTALLMSALFSLILLFGAEFISARYLEKPELGTPLMVGALLLFVSIWRGVFDAILLGCHEFKLVAIGKLLEGTGALIFVPLLSLYFGLTGGLFGLTIAVAIGATASLIFSAQELRKRSVRLEFSSALSEWRMLINFSLPSLIAGTVATPVLWACLLIVARLDNGYAELGLYTSAYQLYTPAVFISMGVASASLPALSSHLMREGLSVFASNLRKTYAVSFAITCSISAPLILFSGYLIGLFGENFSDAQRIMQFLLFAAPFHTSSLINTTAIQAMNISWALVPTHIVWGASLLIASLVLVPINGGLGLAIAFLLSYVILSFLGGCIVIFNLRRMRSRATLQTIQKVW